MDKLPDGIDAIYKVRNRQTGKYSTGSIRPEFTKRGKSFGTYGTVMAHFKMIQLHAPDMLEDYLKSVEVVTFLMKEYKTEQVSLDTLRGL